MTKAGVHKFLTPSSLRDLAMRNSNAQKFSGIPKS